MARTVYWLGVNGVVEMPIKYPRLEWFRYKLLAVLKFVTRGRVASTRCPKTARMEFWFTYHKRLKCCVWQGERLVDAVRKVKFAKKFLTI